MNIRFLKNKTTRFKFVIICLLLAAIFYYPLQYVTKKVSFRIDETVNLGQFSLSVMDHGRGKPITIIEGGLNCGKRSYYNTQFYISDYTRVIAYDHAGIGDSTDSPNPRTLPYYVEELRALMKQKDLAPPFILIGHSLGGYIIRYYAYLYPDEVMGLIFIDSAHEDWFRYVRATYSQEEFRAFFKFWDPATSRNTGAALQELSLYETNCDLIRGIKIPKTISVLMFTGFHKGFFRNNSSDQTEDMKMYIALQHSLIEGLDDAKQIVDWQAGHLFHIDKADLVDKEIKMFIERLSKDIK